MNEKDLVGRVLSLLVARDYGAGERVPSERELALKFQVSRGQIREALSYLEALRIVERRAKSGLFMSTSAPSVEALALFAQIGVPLTSEDVHQAVEMRRIHELEAARLACERRTEDDLERMREVLNRSQEELASGHLTGEVAGDLDRQFHSEIVRATQNSIFLRVVDIYYLMTVERRAVYFQQRNRFRDSHAEHSRIFAAIESRDTAEAVSLVGSHLQGVDSYWARLIESDERPRSDLPTAGDVAQGGDST